MAVFIYFKKKCLVFLNRLEYGFLERDRICWYDNNDQYRLSAAFLSERAAM